MFCIIFHLIVWLLTLTSVAYSEIEYLGYVINKEGIRIVDRKIKAIKAIQPLKINA